MNETKLECLRLAGSNAQDEMDFQIYPRQIKSLKVFGVETADPNSCRVGQQFDNSLEESPWSWSEGLHEQDL